MVQRGLGQRPILFICHSLGGLLAKQVLRKAVDAATVSMEVLREEPYWLRQRSTVLNRQGDVLRTQGDLTGALAAYRESLAVSQRLAGADPSNAAWQRDLGVSYSKVGDV